MFVIVFFLFLGISFFIFSFFFCFLEKNNMFFSPLCFLLSIFVPLFSFFSFDVLKCSFSFFIASCIIFNDDVGHGKYSRLRGVFLKYFFVVEIKLSWCICYARHCPLLKKGKNFLSLSESV